MIQANELRINNYIKDSGEKIWQIDHWECENKVASKRPLLGKVKFTEIPMYGHPFTEYVESLEPIPITEYWLLKFGFVTKDKWNLYYNGLEINKTISIDGKKIDFYTNMFNDSYIIIPLQSVHQLQNLYFSLTGQELELIL